MKIVISGGLGYVGGRLCAHFAAKGHSVTALSRKSANVAHIDFPPNIQVIAPDVILGKSESLMGCDVFIHLASLNEHDCVKYPDEAIHVNITQTRQWLDTALDARVKKFIYFSTAHVYDKPLKGNYDERSIARPLHPYSITHKCAEDFVAMYAVDKGMDNVIIRLTNSFGAAVFPTADRWTLLVNDLCRSAVRHGKMVLMSDGLQLRDFITLGDVCRAVEHLINQKIISNDLIFNLGAGHSRTIWDLASQTHLVAEKVLNREITLQRKEPAEGGVSDQLRISNDKLLNTGFVLQNKVEEEIEATLSYFLKYPSL